MTQFDALETLGLHPESLLIRLNESARGILHYLNLDAVGVAQSEESRAEFGRTLRPNPWIKGFYDSQSEKFQKSFDRCLKDFELQLFDAVIATLKSDNAA